MAGWAYIEDGEVGKVFKYNSAGQPFEADGIFRQAEAFMVNDENFSTLFFSDHFTEEERRTKGVVPLVQDEYPESDEAYTIVSSFEPNGNVCEEHYVLEDKPSDDLINQLKILVDAQCAEVDRNECLARAEGVSWNTHTVQIRVPPEEDIQFIASCVLGALVATSQGQPFSINFTMANNVDVTLDGPQTLDLGQTAMARVSAIHDAAKGIKDSIRAAGTAAAPLTANQYKAKKAAVLAISTEVALE